MPQKTLNVLWGARALAGYIFADEEKWKKVYPLREQLGLFRLSGQICGRPETIDQRIAAREAASIAAIVAAEPEPEPKPKPAIRAKSRKVASKPKRKAKAAAEVLTT